MNCPSQALLLALISIGFVSSPANATADGKGYQQANTMGGGPAPIPVAQSSTNEEAEADRDAGTFRVFILAGQSNMTGHGWARELSAPYKQPHDRIRLWANNRWEYFVPKKNFGPGVAMAHQLASFWPDDTIGIIKVAIGGTGILSFQPDWSKESANRTMDGHKGNLYRDITKAVGRARQVSAFELNGFIWKQGGKDMRSKQLGEEYLSNFEKMLTSLRADLAAPELPAFIATYVTPEQFETYDAPLKLTRPGMAGVLKAHLDAAETISNVVTFSHGDLPCRIDGIHFNTEGQLRLGRMYADAVERYYSAETTRKQEDRASSEQPDAD